MEQISGGMNMTQDSGKEMFLEFQNLTDRKAKLKADLEQVQARLTQLEPMLLNWFGEMDMQSVKAGGRTFFVHRQLWAGRNGVEQNEFCAAFHSAGLEDLVTEQVNSQRLSAWVREQAAELEAGATPEEIKAHLPGPIRDVIKVSEQFSVRSRRS